MAEITYNKLKNYMQNLTSNCVEVEDFVGYFQRDLDNKINSFHGIKTPYLALWQYKKGREGKDQQAQALIQLSYVILTKAENDNFETQYEAVDKCEAIANIVNARVRYDHFQPNHFLHRSFLEERTLVEPVEYENNNFGVEVHLFFKNKDFWKVDADDWADLDSVC